MRVKLMMVQADWWIELHKRRDSISLSQFVVARNPLPHDAEMVRAGHDPFGRLFLVIQSSAYDEVKEGDKIPEIEMPLLKVVDAHAQP